MRAEFADVVLRLAGRDGVGERRVGFPGVLADGIGAVDFGELAGMGNDGAVGAVRRPVDDDLRLSGTTRRLDGLWRRDARRPSRTIDTPFCTPSASGAIAMAMSRVSC